MQQVPLLDGELEKLESMPAALFAPYSASRAERVGGGIGEFDDAVPTVDTVCICTISFHISRDRVYIIE